MAGYVFVLNKDWVEKGGMQTMIQEGVYATIIASPKNKIWNVAVEATFADYITMKENDYVFFFSDRKVYGIGRLKNLCGNCAYKNYNQSSNPKPDITNDALLKSEDYERKRWLCIFEPSPFFFKRGIDMDDVLSSNPNAFKMLRALWRMSFIKLDDVEATALRDIILFRNRGYLKRFDLKYHYTFENHFHTQIENRLKENVGSYDLEAFEILELCNEKGKMKHEMAVELAVLESLKNNSNVIIGKWDYICHQVIASPFKPLIYADKMDLFGYRYLDNGETICDYLVGEIKKDIVKKEDIFQIMKYVDWVCKEYAGNDYSRIKAYLIGYEFDDEAKNEARGIAIRKYTIPSRPPIQDEWKGLKFVQYRYIDKKMRFYEIKY